MEGNGFTTKANEFVWGYDGGGTSWLLLAPDVWLTGEEPDNPTDVGVDDIEIGRSNDRINEK